MSGEAWLYLLAVLLNAVNLFLQVFFTIMFVYISSCYPSLEPMRLLLPVCCSEADVLVRFRYSDLECDYINPIDLCNRLNTYIVPEAAVHAFLTALFLINGYWLARLLNLPHVVFNVKK